MLNVMVAYVKTSRCLKHFLPPNVVAVSMLPSNCETTIKLVNVYSAFSLLDYESKDQLV